MLFTFTGRCTALRPWKLTKNGLSQWILLCHSKQEIVAFYNLAASCGVLSRACSVVAGWIDTLAYVKKTFPEWKNCPVINRCKGGGKHTALNMARHGFSRAHLTR